MNRLDKLYPICCRTYDSSNRHPQDQNYRPYDSDWKKGARSTKNKLKHKTIFITLIRWLLKGPAPKERLRRI